MECSSAAVLKHMVQNLPAELQNCIFQYDDNKSPLESFLIAYFPFALGQSHQADKIFSTVIGHRPWIQSTAQEGITITHHKRKKQRLITTQKIPHDVLLGSLRKLTNMNIDQQSELGNLATIHYLFSIAASNNRARDDAMDWASAHGHLAVVQYLHLAGKECTTWAMNWASQHGHLRVVQYLHAIGQNCTEYAMNWASRNGHLEVVQYLHSIYKNCTEDAMNWAINYGHLEIVQYLHSIGKSCTTYAMNYASENGHLEVVKYLHSIGKTCTSYAIHLARKNRHLAVVEYLHKNGLE